METGSLERPTFHGESLPPKNRQFQPLENFQHTAKEKNCTLKHQLHFHPAFSETLKIPGDVALVATSAETIDVVFTAKIILLLSS